MKSRGERKQALQKLLSDLSVLVDDDIKNLEEDKKTTRSKQPFSNSKRETIYYINSNMLKRGKYQPRGEIDLNSLQELTHSIKAQGILQPLIVRSIGEKKYEVVVGERRWRAAQLAGLTEIPAIINDISDEEATAFALIENLQREDLGPLEEANGYQKLIEEFKFTHDEIAQKVGKSRTSITNVLRLLSLQDEVKVLLREGKLEMGHARALLSLPIEKQVEVAKHVVNRQLSVRGTEKLIQQIKGHVPVLEKLNTDLLNQAKNLSSLLADKLSSEVRIKINNNGEGKMIVNFSSLDEIEWLLKKLG